MTEYRLDELRDQVESIELTEQEIKNALFEGKLKKWNHERHRHYWEKQKGAYEGDEGPTMGYLF